VGDVLPKGFLMNPSILVYPEEDWFFSGKGMFSWKGTPTNFFQSILKRQRKNEEIYYSKQKKKNKKERIKRSLVFP